MLDVDLDKSRLAVGAAGSNDGTPLRFESEPLGVTAEWPVVPGVMVAEVEATLTSDNDGVVLDVVARDSSWALGVAVVAPSSDSSERIDIVEMLISQAS